MFVLVVGGGKVGYYLTKELIESGHEVVLMEKDRARAQQITDEIGSVVIAHDGCEGKYLARPAPTGPTSWPRSPATTRTTSSSARWRSTTSTCPRTIARVNNPKNEALFRHLGVDEIISPTRMILGSIEQDIPVHELLHLARARRAASSRSSRRTSSAGSPADRQRRARPVDPRGLLAVRRHPRRLADAAPAGHRARRGRQGDRDRRGRLRGRPARAAHRGDARSPSEGQLAAAVRLDAGARAAWTPSRSQPGRLTHRLATGTPDILTRRQVALDERCYESLASTASDASERANS